MNPRHTQEQIGLFPAAPQAPSVAEIDRIVAEATRARDAALAASLRRAFGRLGHALAAIGAALVSWPTRRATYEKLRRLSDRELADIGLTRGDIARVFEPDFALPAAPANANAAPAGLRTRAA
jgi:uncharacterized protein YjiS (DUF1127 family)